MWQPHALFCLPSIHQIQSIKSIKSIKFKMEHPVCQWPNKLRGPDHNHEGHTTDAGLAHAQAELDATECIPKGTTKLTPNTQNLLQFHHTWVVGRQQDHTVYVFLHSYLSSCSLFPCFLLPPPPPPPSSMALPQAHSLPPTPPQDSPPPPHLVPVFRHLHQPR